MDATYTAEQLRRDAVAIERMHGETLTVEWRDHQAGLLRAFADALEENARLTRECEFHAKQCARVDELRHRAEAELAAERERAALAIEELRNISKADWREWDEDCRNPQSFVDWAKSRAMFTLAAIDMPHSTQEDAERYRWLREPQDHFGVLVEEMRGDRYTNTHFFAVREELDALIDAARRK